MINIKDTILNESSHIDNVFNYSIKDESYFDLTLNFLAEMKHEYANSYKMLNYAIMESNNDIVVLDEGFSDFFSKIKVLIDKFIAFIKRLFEKFVIFLHKLVSSDSYLKSNKDKFGSFDSDDEFDIQGYNYIFSADIPSCKAYNVFKDGFFELNFEDGEDKRNDNTKLIKDSYENFKKKLDEGDIYDSVRAEVLGRTGEKIYKEDYSDELFRQFRNGDNSRTTITVDSVVVNEALTEFLNSNTLIKGIEKNKKEIENEYKKIKEIVKNVVAKGDKAADAISLKAIQKIDDTFASTDAVATKEDEKNAIAVEKDVYKVIDLFITAKCNEIMEISNIHSLAFSAKLDAAKSAVKQDKAILYKALSKIASHKDK